MNWLTAINSYRCALINLYSLAVDDINIVDIANGLARICRFNGQVAGFITVAGHSIRCAQYAIDNCRADVALECLLHDSAEAYIGDLVRPLKNHPDFRANYLALEEVVEKVISEAIGFNYPFDPFVKEADIHDSKLEMGENNDGERFNPHRWDDPDVKSSEFLYLFRQLMRERNLKNAGIKGSCFG